jgi:diguanylate cyclase (GGDEF)-like protein
VRTSPKAAPGVPLGADGGAKRPISFVATKIVQQALNEEVELADLAKLAECDAGFALRVVSIANSGAFGRRAEISNVQRACFFLGVRGLRNVALGLVLGDMAPPSEDGAFLLAMSLRRAVAARLIGEALRAPRADDAFTAGMFLELALLVRARTDLAGACQIARMPIAHRVAIERAYGFEEHTAEGAKLAAEMHLTDAVVYAIAHHHDAEPPEDHLAKIAWAAERVAGAWEGGEASAVRSVAEQALSAVGLNAEAAAEVLRRVPESLTLLAAAFERRIDEQIDLDKLAADAHAQLVEMNHGYERLVRRLEALVAEKEALAAELKRANLDLETLAATDALTRLPNKRSFATTLARDLALAARNGAHVSVVMVDIDHFKRINDTWGHTTGDLALVQVADALAKSARESDMVARFGGEEFVAVLSGASSGGARIVAERMRAAVERLSIQTPNGLLKVTASFGIASVQPRGANGGTDLVARADHALYEAKRAGRNRVALSADAEDVATRPSPRS